MKRMILHVLFSINAVFCSAQKKDSLKSKKINEVVITGQYSPQSINKSIYKVEIIDNSQIKNMAANTVAEVLNQNLNILLIPDQSSGNSSVNIMGLGGEYTKVLVDNIPIVSDQSFGNFIDLTKLNINNVERIEIVKGSMGVEYGNNAVAGVINIITKKNAIKKISGNINLQEETVGKNYDWYKKGNGRHIQNVNLGFKISDIWFASLDFNHNDFQGFEGKQKGYRYFSENNDGLRGYEWQPKDLINSNALIRFNKGKTSVFYKLSLLKEEIQYRNPVVEVKNFDGGKRTYLAKDRDYSTQRWIHQLNIQTKLGSRIQYLGDFSYQNQLRKYQDYIYDIPNRKENSRDEKNNYYDSGVFYSRGMFSNFWDKENFNFQLGYELDNTNGYASSLTGTFRNGNLRRRIFNYSNFISAEWQITPYLSIRPGARLALSDRFNQQYNYSLTSKVAITPKSDLRLIVGSANRFPSYDELYTYMVDANHDIRGNENLKPETGNSFGAFWDYKKNAKTSFHFSLSSMYLQVKNRISLALINNQPLQYQYLNIDDYKSLLFGGSFQIKKEGFSLNAGASVLGISQVFHAEGVKSPNDFNYYFEGNLAMNYQLQKLKTLFALFYKYTGRSWLYTTKAKENISSPTEFVLGEVGDFNMLNFTVSQPFLSEKLEFSLGIKNIFNVTNVLNTVQTGGAHSAAVNTQNLFYGRSYFARIIYSF